MRFVSSLLAGLSFLSLVACEGAGGPKKANSNLPPCDISVDTLSGDWVSFKGTGSAVVTDKFTRAWFGEEGGKKKVVFTPGKISGENPATNKMTYEFAEKTKEGVVVFYRNLIGNRTPERIERMKKDNRKEELKFESRLEVSVEPRMCVLQISEKVRTYVKGQPQDGAGAAGDKTYGRPKAGTELSHVHCTEPQGILPFAKGEVDFEKDQALDLKAGVFAGSKVWFHYAPIAYDELPKDEQIKKWEEVGAKAKEGCTYDFEIWTRDERVLTAQKLPVTPKAETGILPWIWETAFDKSAVAGVFVEMHRYATCGGERKLLSNACTVVWPERPAGETPAAGGAPVAPAAPAVPAAPVKIGG